MVSKVLAIIFGAIGGGFLLITLFFVISTNMFISQASVAEGTVISAAPPDTGRRSAAQIRFNDANGQVVQFTTNVNSNPPEFQLGQKVRIYYNLADPQSSARADSFLSLWFLSGLFGLFALIFGGIGLGSFTIWLLNRKSRAKT